MRSLVLLCLNRRWWVVVIAALVMIAGLVIAGRSPIDAFPEFAPPLVEIQTEAPGLSSLEVETLVTTPIENALAGTSFSTTVRSRSVLGLSSVVVLFEQGTDLFIARQLVQERLSRSNGLLPATARTPVVLAPLSSTSRIMKVGLTSEVMTQTDLTDLVYWTVRPRLLAIPGVANVAVWGAREREYSIRVDPNRMAAVGVTSSELLRTLSGATTPSSGGYLDGPLQRMPLQIVAIGESDNETHVSQLSRLPIATRNGASVALSDVATVEDTFPPPIGDAVINDQPGILLIVEKQPWGNTLEITRRIDAALTALSPAMPGVNVDANIFRPASFIERSISNLEHAMLIGCGLVLMILFLFLWSWRTALISAVAIPLSLGIAVIVLRAIGTTLNTMVLAGLVIALGEVVDDAIIDVENILRRLRENAHLATPRPAISVALDASLEVRGAVVYATVIVILVFLPVWFLEGVAGSFFRPLATAYALGVLASMCVALTVTPAMSILLLPKSVADEHSKGERRSPLLLWLERRYEKVLPRILAKPRTILGAGLSTLIAGLVGFFLLGDAFLPEFRENDFLMHWVAQPGTSLPALQRTTLRISRELRAIPGIDSFGAHLGRAEVADEVVGPNFAELWVHVDERQDHELTTGRIRTTIARYPGLRRDLETYLRERIEEVVSGTQGAIVVRLFGPDLGSLRSSADNLATLIGRIPGVTTARVEQQVLVPEVRIEPRPEAAALGFLAGDIRDAITLLVRGQRVGEITRNGHSIPVVVRGPQASTEDLSSLRETMVSSNSGARSRLGDVATLAITPTPNAVPHERGSRRIDISIAVTGDLGSVARQVERTIGQVELPVAHHAEVLGEWRERNAAARRLVLLSLLSLLLILGVLYSDLKTWRRTVLVAATLPFAVVGGVLGAWLTGGILSLGSLVGLVTVLGIAARNGILLVSHYQHLESEGLPFEPSLIMRGAIERLGPILMTAFATGLALLPIVIAGDRPGHEIEHPMAVVILGGLFSSTLLNLVVLPVLYLRFGKERPTPIRNQ